MIRGRKGGGSPPPPPAPTEAANTLQSRATVRILDLLSHGAIAGLETGDGKSIYLDDTPLMASDGSLNFDRSQAQWRVGLPDQAPIAGFPLAETLASTSTEIRTDNPVVRTVTDAAVGAVRLLITMPQFTISDSQGNIKGGRVDLAVYVAVDGGAYVKVGGNVIIEGKTSSEYQRAVRISLPDSDGPRNIKVVRLTADSDSSYTQNKTYLSGYVEIVDESGYHPNMALVGLTLDARDFSQMPRRSYLVRGLLIQVPTNRTADYSQQPPIITYNGAWDGTFKMEWCPNPAWVCYDLAVNPAYGLALPAASVDKWSLYDIGRYCDTLVSDGRGGQEVRYEFHAVLNSQQDAYQVLSDVASCFHGAPVWAGSVLTFIADSPRDPDMLVTPANVIDGRIAYREMDGLSRWNTIYVTWSDPSDGYRPAIEVTVDHKDVANRGEVRRDVIAAGCTSRAAARRYGRWHLDTAQYNRGVVSYQASFDHAGVGPGMIVEIADPAWAGARHGGRARVWTPNTLTLDAPVTLATGATYQLSVMASDNTPMTMPVLTGAGEHATLTINGTWPKQQVPGAVWALSGGDVATTQWRVVSVTEVEPHIVEVTAVHHDPAKYGRIEAGVTFSDPATSRLPDITAIPTPTALVVAEGTTSTLEGGLFRYMDLTWTPVDYPYLRHYLAGIRRDGGNWEPLPTVSVPPVRVLDVQAGTYQLRVQAVSILGHRGPWALLDHTVLWGAPIALAPVSGLEIAGQGNSSEYAGPDVHLSWWDGSATGNITGDNPLGADAGYRDASLVGYRVVVSDPDSGTIIHRELVEATNYTFTLAKNAETTARAGLVGPLRRLLFTVRPVESYNRDDDEAAIAAIEVFNPPPLIPSDLTITAGEEQVRVSYTTPGDLDFMGLRVYADRTPGFTPNPGQGGNLIHQGGGSPLVLSLATGTWYVRVETYDAFGAVGLNMSGEYVLEILERVTRVASLSQMGRLFPLSGSAYWSAPSNIIAARLLQVEAEVGQAAIGREIIAHLRLEGTLIAAITIPAGSLSATPQALALTILPGGRLTVDLIQVGSINYGFDLRVRVLWRPEEG